jgi:hypothetical protein
MQKEVGMHSACMKLALAGNLTWYVALKRFIVLLYRCPYGIIVTAQPCILDGLRQRPQTLYVAACQLIQLLQRCLRLVAAVDEALQQLQQVLQAESAHNAHNQLHCSPSVQSVAKCTQDTATAS